MKGSRLSAVLAFGALALGCGGASKHGTAVGDEAAAGRGAAGGDAAGEVASPLGWSVLNDVPFVPPVGPGTALVDSLRDRLLTFTGIGAIWQLPLSGAKVDRWSPLAAQGEGPSGPIGSAVYDSERDRVLARVEASLPGGYVQGQLWALSLADDPTWRQLRPPPLPEVASSLLALDVEGARLFVLGGGNGLWTLSLQDDANWTRVAASPGQTPSDLYAGAFGGGTLAFDRPRQRLVASTLSIGTWQLPLGDESWTQLDGVDAVSRFNGLGPVVHDAAGSQLIQLDAYQGQLRIFSLSSDTWAQSAFAPDSLHGGLAAFDEKRARVLYASGSATSELPLASLIPRPLLPERSGVGTSIASSLIWDPKREAVVNLGGEGVQATLTHTLKRGAEWELLTADGPPGYGGSHAYDAETNSIFSFGAFSYGASNAMLMRLDPGAEAWQVDALPVGPEARSWQLGVLDTRTRRLVIRGGALLAADLGVSDDVDDVWTLSLADLTWTRLSPGGTSPGPRHGELGVYDPIGERLVVLGGSADEQPDANLENLHELSLGDDPTWSTLSATGAGPAGLASSAFYDRAGRRMVVLASTGAAIDVYALELSGSPAWHRFCARGAVPPFGEKATLTDAGIFLALGETAGAYLFNLETPYCD